MRSMKFWYAINLGLAQLDSVCRQVLTLQEAFDVIEFACVVEFSKVFCLLRKVFSLCKCVSLVRHEIRGDGVELGDE